MWFGQSYGGGSDRPRREHGLYGPWEGSLAKFTPTVAGGESDVCPRST